MEKEQILKSMIFEELHGFVYSLTHLQFVKIQETEASIHMTVHIKHCKKQILHKHCMVKLDWYITWVAVTWLHAKF